ncbi:DUF2867 domain-containing protein [Arsenophonus sp.]|uniref:DUF2867 domain-containing protein n=1 Tax=Arsenophonus sp. TaxID=1872640 RepID=UPI0028592F7F|nr:DUF2867 domain-containing protein [Arsenophonus sp.]MDR5615702.1 DUF2867 domain-containing protein [Arsenophonus sp.]
MGKKRILVLGANGYIGQNLIPALIKQGHMITAATRQLDWARAQNWPNTQCCYVDLLAAKTLNNIMTNIDIVYFLVHSMAANNNLIEQECLAALNVKNVLKHSQVKQVIYLSALQNPCCHSQHLMARKLTGEILRESKIPLTEIRAPIIIGAGSAPYEIIRDMTYNLLILTPPRWVRSKSCPIALENMLYYLTQLIAHPTNEHRILDAGGPEYIDYQTLFKRFMQISGKYRPLIPLPIPIRLISIQFISLVTSVSPSITKSLIQGLQHNLPANDQALKQLIPQKLLSVDEAIKQAFIHSPNAINKADWGSDPILKTKWCDQYSYYPKDAGFTLTTRATSRTIWQIVQQIGGKRGYFYANILWQLRALIDDLMLNKVKYGRPIREELYLSDMIDSWKVINIKPGHQLTLLFGMKAPGLGRLTFTIKDYGKYRTLDVRAWWHAAGFSGLMYWLIMSPIHRFIFKGMAKKINKIALIMHKKQ